MNRFLAAVMVLSLFLNGCARALPEEGVKLHAMIVSDLHFTADPDVSTAVVAAMAYSQKLSEALTQEVIARKPDVLILTGDHTNSGKKADMTALRELLEKVKKEGIPVVMTTGNHDFNLCTVNQYRSIYGPLMEKETEDPSSLSYAVTIKDVRLLAMDDSSFDQGASGTFSDETMRWLKGQLEQSRRERIPVLFLSHHTVLAAKQDPGQVWRITNEGLVGMLKQYGVRLCLSGHLHSFMTAESGSLHEIVSGTPLTGRHEIGILDLDETGVNYHTEPLDLRTYGEEGLYEAIAAMDQNERKQREEVFAGILAQENVPEKERAGILSLAMEFFEYAEEGTLVNHAEALKNSPYYEGMIQALWNHNYGPWMKELTENPPRNGKELSFSW